MLDTPRSCFESFNKRRKMEKKIKEKKKKKGKKTLIHGRADGRRSECESQITDYGTVIATFGIAPLGSFREGAWK